jgi:ComF family protein
MFDHLLGLLAPHECIGCNAEGFVLCDPCFDSLGPAQARCYRCQSVPAWNTCSACIPQSALRRVQALARYNHPLTKHMLWRLKFGRARAAAEDIARHMATQAPSGSYLIVPAPTASNRVRSRGYDQACLIAKALARYFPGRYTYAPLLRRQGHTRQLGTARALRLKQLDNSFRVTRRIHSAQPILLVDDVITTGSTLQAAAQALQKAGATHIEALVFAQA